MTLCPYEGHKCLYWDEGFEINHFKALEANNNVMSKPQKTLVCWTIALLNYIAEEVHSWIWWYCKGMSGISRAWLSFNAVTNWPNPIYKYWVKPGINRIEWGVRTTGNIPRSFKLFSVTEIINSIKISV